MPTGADELLRTTAALLDASTRAGLYEPARLGEGASGVTAKTFVGTSACARPLATLAGRLGESAGPGLFCCEGAARRAAVEAVGAGLWPAGKLLSIFCERPAPTTPRIERLADI